jgi:hypothetical protein
MQHSRGVNLFCVFWVTKSFNGTTRRECLRQRKTGGKKSRVKDLIYRGFLFFEVSQSSNRGNII